MDFDVEEVRAQPTEMRFRLSQLTNKIDFLKKLKDFVRGCEKCAIPKNIIELFQHYARGDGYHLTHRVHVFTMGQNIELSVPEEERGLFMETLEEARKRNNYLFKNILVQELFKHQWCQPFIEVDPQPEQARVDDPRTEVRLSRFLKNFAEQMKLGSCYLHVWERAVDNYPEPASLRWHIYVRRDVRGLIPYRVKWEVFYKKLVAWDRMLAEDPENIYRPDKNPIENGQMRGWNTAKLMDEDRKYYHHSSVWEYTAGTPKKLPRNEPVVLGDIRCGCVHTWYSPVRKHYRDDSLVDALWREDLAGNLPRNTPFRPHRSLSMSNLTFNWRPAQNFRQAINEFIPELANKAKFETIDDLNEYATAKILPIAQRYFARYQTDLYFIEPNGVFKHINNETNTARMVPFYVLNQWSKQQGKSHTVFQRTEFTDIYSEPDSNGGREPTQSQDSQNSQGAKRRKTKHLKWSLFDFLWESTSLAKFAKSFGHADMGADVLNTYSGPGLFPGEAAQFVKSYPMFSKLCIQKFLQLLKHAICAGEGILFNKWAVGALLHGMLYLLQEPTSKEQWEWIVGLIGEPGSGKNTLQEVLVNVVGFNNCRIEAGVTGLEVATGKFNSSMAGTILLWLDECREMGIENLQRTKANSTNKVTQINGKFKDPYQINNTTTTFLSANNFEAALEEGERRILVIQTKRHPKGDEFYSIINDMLFKHDGWKAIAFYLYTLVPNSKFAAKGKEPCASVLKQNLLNSTRHKFMEVLYNSHRDIQWDERIPIIMNSGFLSRSGITKINGRDVEDCNETYDLHFMGDCEYEWNTGLSVNGEYGPQWPAMLLLDYVKQIYFTDKRVNQGEINNFLDHWERAWLKYHADNFTEDQTRNDWHRQRLAAGHKTSHFLLEHFPHFKSLVVRKPGNKPDANPYNFYNKDVLLMPRYSDAKQFFDTVYRRPEFVTPEKAQNAFPQNWTRFETFIDAVAHPFIWDVEQEDETYYDDLDAPITQMSDPKCKVPGEAGSAIHYLIDSNCRFSSQQ